MINLRQDYDDLTERFAANWSSDLPVIYDNQPKADYPNGCVHFSVVLGASKHLYGDATNGGKLQQGRVWLWIDIPDEKGDAQAIALIDQFSALFRNWNNESINCRTEELSSSYVLPNNQVRFRVSVFFTSVRPYS